MIKKKSIHGGVHAHRAARRHHHHRHSRQHRAARVQQRAGQGPADQGLAQAKQIGLALKLFAGDNDGVYPKNGVPTIITAVPANSNDAFSALFPTYTTSEKIFGNKLAVGWQTGKAPMTKIDNPATYPPTKTLKAGENVYGYMMGLTDASPRPPDRFRRPGRHAALTARQTVRKARSGAPRRPSSSISITMRRSKTSIAAQSRCSSTTRSRTRRSAFSIRPRIPTSRVARCCCRSKIDCPLLKRLGNRPRRKSRPVLRVGIYPAAAFDMWVYSRLQMA